MAHHGNTPAAWTAVCVALAAFIVAGIGLMVGSWLMFWIGCRPRARRGRRRCVIMSKMGLNA